MPEEELALRRLIEIKCREDVAKELNRSLASVFDKAKRLGLRFRVRSVKSGRNWTKLDDQTLLFLSTTKTREQIAKKLNRTPNAVGQRARELKITLSGRRLMVPDVAKILGVHKQTVVRIRDLLGLKFRSYAKNQVRGATDEDIVAIARWLLSNPKSRHKSQRRLLEVINDHSPATYG